MTATITPKVEQAAPAVTPAASKGWRRFVPRIFGTILWLVAIICALAAIGRAFRSGMQPIRQTLDVLLVPAPANLAYAVFLAMLATATLSRKRVAWWFLTVYFVISAVVGAALASALTFVPDADLVDEAGNDLFDTTDTILLWVSIGISILALVALFLAKREFYAKVRKGSFRRALLVLVVLVAIGIGLGYSLVAAFPGTLSSTGDQLEYAAEHVLGGAISFDLTRTGHAPGWVNLILGLFGAIALFAALATLLRARSKSSTLPADDEQRIRATAREVRRPRLARLLRHPPRQGRDLLAERQGRRHLPGGQRGEPRQRRPGRRPGGVGAGDRGLAATQARQYAWTPAVMGASEEGAIAYARAGLEGDPARRRGDPAHRASSHWTAGTCGPSGRP